MWKKEVLCAAGVLLCFCTSHAVHQDSSSYTHTAVSGHPTVLPCPTAPLTSQRASPYQAYPSLILVFKDGLSSPVYSWDTRQKPASTAGHCASCSSHQLAGRAYFWAPTLTFAKSSKASTSQLTPNWRTHVFHASFVAPPPQNTTRNEEENATRKPGAYSSGGPKSWTPQETGLVLDPVRLSDAGDYLCRVDFPNSPTRNTFVKLRVVEPMKSIAVRGFVTNTSKEKISSNLNKTQERNSSEKSPSPPMKNIASEKIDELPRVQDDWRSFDNTFPGKKKEISLKRSLGPASLAPPKVLGPYPVGADVLLQCEVIHGTPAPTLRWEDDDGSPIAPSTLTAGQRRSSISYRLANVSLASVGASVTCVAQNSPLTPVLRETVVIDVGVPPTSLRIFKPPTTPSSPELGDSTLPHPSNWTLLVESQSGPHIMTLTTTEGRELTLVCEGGPSRPPTPLQWTRPDRRGLDSGLVEVSHLASSPPSLTLTRSALHILPSAALHGIVLQCSTPAESAQQPSALSAAVQLSVEYSPQVTLTTNTTTPVVENSPVAFQCRVAAFPPTEGPVLLFRGDEIVHVWNTSRAREETGVVTVVREVAGSGRYTCGARNSVGRGVSPPLHIRVNYAPRCAGSPPTSYSTRGGEPLLVTCSVSSQPRPLGFRWFVIPSNGSDPVEVAPHTDQGRSSTLEYVPPRLPPYPSLQCYAHNEVGDMKVPCVFHILAAAEPDSVHACTAGPSDTDKENPPISVVCVPGRNGGLNQSFTLEVRPTRNPLARPPKALYLSSSPSFDIEGLTPDEEYTFTITASNARGLSVPYVLTYVVPVNKIQAFPSVILHEDVTPALLIAFGAMAAVALCSVGALLARCFFVRNKEGRVNNRHDSDGFPTPSSDYRRLRQCYSGSLSRGTTKQTMLTSCRGSSAAKGRSCFYADVSSCGDDSLSRSSCRSAADTLLWTLTSDSESNHTFRNSGCYHIANLTPPECCNTLVSPHSAADCRNHQILVTEIHAPDTPRSTSSRSSALSSHAQKLFHNSPPCQCSSPASLRNVKSCPSPCDVPKGRQNKRSYIPVHDLESRSCESRRCDSSMSQESQFSSPEFRGNERCSCRDHSAARPETDFDVTGPCPEVEALLAPKVLPREINCLCDPKQHRTENETYCAKLHQNPASEHSKMLHLTGSEEPQGKQLNSEDLERSSTDSSDVKETCMTLLTASFTSDASSDQSSRPSSSVSVATVALNPNYDPDQQLSETES